MKTCPSCNIGFPEALEVCPRDGTLLPGRPAEPLHDTLIGSTIDGRYVVEKVLGQGGMGYVYGARHAIIDKQVAIKVLRAEQAQGDESASQRFLVEAKAASKIGHQNIVDITDFGELPDGQAYFVMEFLAGPTLGKIVHDDGHLPPLRAIAIAVQIARGLQAAHDKGIIHRDLKPENVFVLERDGQTDVVKIVDFGIAKDQSHTKKLTQVGMVLGTPEYMAPEQATGQPSDHRVDLYALGCILYEMLTGDVPYKGDSPTQTLTMHVFQKVVPPSVKRPDLKVPASLEAVILRTLEKKPTARYADLRELMAALEDVDRELRGQRPQAVHRTAESQARAAAKTAPPSSQYGGQGETRAAIEAIRPKRRLPIMLGAGAATLLVVLSLGLLITRGTSAPAPPAPKPAVETGTPVPAHDKPPAADSHSKSADEVELVLRSQPEGADIFEGAERLGTSPVNLRRPRGDGTIVLTFRHAGYRDEIRRLVPSRDKELEVVLEPKRDKVGTTHRPSKTPTPTTNVTEPAQSRPARHAADLRNPFN